MVEFDGVVKRFGNVTAVEKMHLQVPEGSLVTLLGPSGCGKTTLLRMLAGLETPTEGEIRIRGRRINETPIHKRNLGMIFQNYALFPHKSIFDNVAFGLKYRSVPRNEVQTRVREALEMVRLPGVENRMPSQLSGGQQQRIALARAIVIRPDVLLMDEPLSALDENLREEMRREIDNLQRVLGITTLFVTHDQREALSMSDRILVMKDGHKQQEGHPEEVYNKPANRFVADFIGHSNFFPGVVEALDGSTARVKLDIGALALADTNRHWEVGQRVDAVVRAQRFELMRKGEDPSDAPENRFTGTIKDRSYMGGEVSYFVDIGEDREVHVISLMRSWLLSPGDAVVARVAPMHCHLIPEEPVP